MAAIVYEYLTDKEKNDILSSHIRSNEYSIYNLAVKKIEEMAGTASAETLADIDNQILDFQNKIAVLKTEQSVLVLE